MARVELENITSAYGMDVRLRLRHLVFEAGERVAVVGPSGSGKSTLLRTLAGLMPPTVKGRLVFNNRDVTSLSACERHIGFVFQDFALYPHLSVFDNLSLSLRFAASRTKTAVATHDSMRERVRTITTIFEIDHLLERRPTQLSGGQQQRVAIVRALIRGSSLNLLLMDEPLSDLDGQLRMRTRDHIIDQQERFGTTMVHVTHDREEAMAVGHRVLVLRDGTIEQIGTPAELYRSPANLFVASFLGELALNTYPAVVREGQLQFAGISIPVPANANIDSGTDVIVGIRPELMNITPSMNGSPRDNKKIVVEALRVEPLGSRSIIHARLSCGEKIRFMAQSRLLENGERWFEIDLLSSPAFAFTANGLRLF